MLFKHKSILSSLDLSSVHSIKEICGMERKPPQYAFLKPHGYNRADTK